MKIAIEIPKEEYEDIINSEDCGLHVLTRAIAKGTPLPKGHGNLIDADAFANFLKNTSKTQRYNEFIIDKQLTGVTVDDVINAICESLQDENSAPTIIGADKAESEG